ncbi:MAG: protein translocase subunit SecD [Endomicrobiales bacterium]|nr:protein translocase subunit SecD [Endomicrobiales bacterium]
MSRLQVKILVTVLFLGLAIYFLYPTVEWYGLSQQERDKRERLKDKIVSKILNLGLDLRGGIHLVLELDADKLEPGVDVNDAIGRAIEIIRNRVDQFGVAEPLIARQGERWIVIQLPGIKDPERAKDLIGKTALLEFRLVDESTALGDIAEELREKEARFEELNDFPEIVKMIPKGHAVFPGKEDRYYILKSSPELTGAYLVDAKVNIGGEFGYPHVSIEFNRDGAKIFSRVTGENIERNLAIVLDGVVQSAPVIRTRIPDGKAIIEGNFTMEDAKLLATILRAGALPAPVKIIEERSVGPTLGEDSIKAGVKATIFGAIVVLIFMAFYYKFSGLIADFALFLNIILLLGLMAYFRFTLTLPGMAGIILTLGMAVDANVLILERIREELKAGKTHRLAVDAGYQKAFHTIMDANVTTLIAAIFLFQFGTGPVKGFAVTLTLGILVSMFTAILVTKSIYELLFQERIIEKLSL